MHQSSLSCIDEVAEGSEIEPENGKDIVTTIDVNIQDIAENAFGIQAPPPKSIAPQTRRS